jgi:hypothetical protein
VTKFVVQQSEALFEARFAVPAFALLSPSTRSLHQNMLLSLGKHGLTLGDIRVESGLPNLSEAKATYSLNILNALVRVWLDRLEVFFLDLARVREDRMIEIAETALETMQRTVPDLKIETCTAVLTMHGTPQDVEVSQFTARYVKNAPEGLGTVLGSGVVYYLGPEAERRSASLVLDMSAAIPGALLVKTSVVFDGTKLPIAHGLSAAREYVFKTLATLHLEPSWEG